MSAEPQVVFDAFHPAHRSNPYPRYAAVREYTALYPLKPGIHLATRYAEVSAVLADPEWGHGYEDGINPFRPGVAADDVPGGIVRMDPPQHTRVRALVNRPFTPRNTEKLRSRVERRVNELLDQALEAGEVDLMEAFARPVPFTIIAEMLGIPPEDYRQVMKWSLALVHGTDPDILQTPEQLAQRDKANAEFEAYFADQIERRRETRRDDMFSDMAEALESGAATGAELRGLCVALLIGGYETAADLIGKGVVALLRDPAQMTLWRERPELAPSGTEELLRYEPPIQLTHRVALRDKELAGHTFARGDGVVIVMAAANRDPAVYADPDRLDITRFAGTAPPPRPLSFGGGVHFCLGAHLGKLEVRLAVDALLRRAPALALAGEPVWRDTVAIHSLDTLPVRLRA
ncbi:cytochrome P450 [Thermocatellispora tengchongensis]|uniref:Cytochrome P450 n=1 Tax=Thermocatellispora tengchongensis TaxID=1073253 RepID=A0A840PBM4_9ACTN|nr:cytochrome P450 [Thermocatellispora tengchongensis]MBB5136652.1 cytochrome P450 [Thermocatellispora tengchongensis]